MKKNLSLVIGTPYEGFTPAQWAVNYIERYGQIDGDHHKLWVMDQVVRILKGTPVELKIARWDGGYHEYRPITGKPSVEYLQWVEIMKGEYNEEDDEYEYGYDEGVVP